MRRMVLLVVVLAVAGAGLVGCVPRPHHELLVTSGGDGVDAVPGDGAVKRHQGPATAPFGLPCSRPTPCRPGHRSRCG